MTSSSDSGYVCGMTLVDFFVVGTQKGGTTALHSYLSRHPGIDMPRIKEIHHFDDETVDWGRPDHSRLHGFYDLSRSALRGESTPIYCYWPDAIERIHQYNPCAKLIMALRHPLHRAVSHWRMEAARGAENLPLADAVSSAGRNRVSAAPKGAHRVYSFVERGFYSVQIERIYRFFPRDNVYVYRTDALWERPGAILSAIEVFLGLEPNLGQLIEPRYIAPTFAPEYSIDPSVADYLREEFAADIIRTADITGLDLSDWNDRYAEPMIKPVNVAPQTVTALTDGGKAS